MWVSEQRSTLVDVLGGEGFPDGEVSIGALDLGFLFMRKGWRWSSEQVSHMHFGISWAKMAPSETEFCNSDNEVTSRQVEELPSGSSM